MSRPSARTRRGVERRGIIRLENLCSGYSKVKRVSYVNLIEKERTRQTDDETLCANSPCMDSGEAGSLSIRPSASLAATKSATGSR